MTNNARLVDDSGNTLVDFADDSLGIYLKSLDLGFPVIRETTTSLSGQDGEYDVTHLLGSRAITAEVEFTDTVSASAGLNTLRGLMHPARRYWLFTAMDGWPAELMIRVRGASFTHATASLPWGAQLGWKAPSPNFLAAALSTITLNPAIQVGGGRTYPKTYPFLYDSGLAPGASVVQVDGTVSATPTIDIYGPCSGPLIRVLDTGASLSFPSLTIAQGDYLHIDVAARTITLNSIATQSLYSALDFSTAVWPVLPPGSPQVIFSPASSSPGAVAVMSWRSSWL